MFSLQTIFGKGDKFYGLLEASAESARLSAKALIELLSTPATQQSLEKFKLARRREKDLFLQINEELVNTFVTVLDREDIEALNSAFYKIPKIVEKFAERYTLALDRMGIVDFTSQAEMLEQACKALKQMVGLSGAVIAFKLARLRTSLEPKQALPIITLHSIEDPEFFSAGLKNIVTHKNDPKQTCGVAGSASFKLVWIRKRWAKKLAHRKLIYNVLYRTNALFSSADDALTSPDLA